MLRVRCFSGVVSVLVPVRYHSLVAHYAQFDANGWYSYSECQLWLQLPGARVA